jgi:hypothetical protein
LVQYYHENVVRGSNAFIVNKGGTGSDTNGNNMNYGIWMTNLHIIIKGINYYLLKWIVIKMGRVGFRTELALK